MSCSIAIVLLGAALLSAVVAASPASAASCTVVLHVEPQGVCCERDIVCFSTLQDAFDAVQDGECIRVAGGEYAASKLDTPLAGIRIEAGWDACFLARDTQALSISGEAPADSTSAAGLTIEDGTLRIESPPPTYGEDVAPFLESTCGGCHINLSQGGFNFANGRDDLVNQNSNQNGAPYIVPCNPEGSYLWHKVNGTQDTVGGSGGMMPPGGSLTDPQFETLEDWILGGALP